MNVRDILNGTNRDDTADLAAHLDALAAEVPPVPVVQGQLPNNVAKFVESVDREFEKTVIRLADTAARMYQAAGELEERARQLREAGPTLTDDIKRWIQFEDESRRKEEFYRTLFSK